MTSKETIQAREAQNHLPSYHHHYYTATPKHSRYNSANDANRAGAGRNSIDTPEIYTVCTPRLSYGPEIGRKHGRSL
ncbi:hypothetical protein ANCCAN_21439 [Ancylostoma caninum]|uniref:Uncharacterized protein n=1 Tax=Ancylostoma caninum TaxID=29170 RepID=A0A368FKI9_ANCCA|nr:hypothetical protein ANCCAN_21439 [Ancylostoma caninum]